MADVDEKEKAVDEVQLEEGSFGSSPAGQQQQPSWLDSIPARFAAAGILGQGAVLAADAARAVSGMDNAEMAEAAHDGGKAIGSAMCGGAVGVLFANAMENLSNASDQLAADGSAEAEGIALVDGDRDIGDGCRAPSKEGASLG